MILFKEINFMQQALFFISHTLNHHNANDANTGKKLLYVFNYNGDKWETKYFKRVPDLEKITK